MCTCATQTNDARRARRATLGTCSGWCRKTPFLLIVSAGAAAIDDGPLRAAAPRAARRARPSIARASASCCCGTRLRALRPAALDGAAPAARGSGGRAEAQPAPSSSSRTGEFRAVPRDVRESRSPRSCARARTSGLAPKRRARVAGYRRAGPARRRGVPAEPLGAAGDVRRARPRRRGAARGVRRRDARAHQRARSTCCGESTRARGGGSGGIRVKERAVRSAPHARCAPFEQLGPLSGPMMEAYSTSRCAMAVMRAHLVAGETRDAARYYQVARAILSPHQLESSTTRRVRRLSRPPIRLLKAETTRFQMGTQPCLARSVPTQGYAF